MGDATGPMGHVVEYITSQNATAAVEDNLLRVRKRTGKQETVETYQGQSILAYLKSQVRVRDVLG